MCQLLRELATGLLVNNANSFFLTFDRPGENHQLGTTPPYLILHPFCFQVYPNVQNSEDVQNYGETDGIK